MTETWGGATGRLCRLHLVVLAFAQSKSHKRQLRRQDTDYDMVNPDTRRGLDPQPRGEQPAGTEATLTAPVRVGCGPTQQVLLARCPPEGPHQHSVAKAFPSRTDVTLHHCCYDAIVSCIQHENTGFISLTC